MFSGYQIIKEIGRGGMAVVYVAMDSKFDAKVAVKVLNKDLTHNDNFRKRFLAEARVMFRMSHPHIIKVTDLIDEGETVAFVMEYVDGETLKDYLTRKGRLNENEIKYLFSQMLDAVAYVHKQKLVHRDIKPSNFMVDKEGNIKLMDFGIAKNTDSANPEYTQTGTSMQMGTLMYMSPEQITETKSVTAQSDIYSLGVLLWQMVMGRKPYDNEMFSNFQLQTKIVNEPLELTGTWWDDIILMATAKDPDSRFLNCVEFNAALSRDAYSEPVKLNSSIDDLTVIEMESKSEVPDQSVLTRQLFLEFEIDKLISRVFGGVKNVMIFPPNAEELLDCYDIPDQFRNQIQVLCSYNKTRIIFSGSHEVTLMLYNPDEGSDDPMTILMGVNREYIVSLIFPIDGLEECVATRLNSLGGTLFITCEDDESVFENKFDLPQEIRRAVMKLWEEVQVYRNSDDSEVIIGNQIWMAENLDVEHFSNGDPIPSVWSEEEWELANANKQPAWCYFGYDENRDDGVKQYNWFAVNDSRGLAPAGWLVPNRDQWKRLVVYIGWDAGLVAEEGFKVEYLFRIGFVKGRFEGDMDHSHIFWLRDEEDADSAWFWCMVSRGYVSAISTSGKGVGMPIRCVKEI
jgi:uncharacterized protein (TIGR02145 family)